MKDDNRLCSLQLMTPSENCLKSAKNRDSNYVLNRSSKKLIKAINLTTNEVHYFPRMYSVKKELGVCAGLVKHICDKVYGYKSGRSKFDDCWYTFEYAD